MQVYINIKKQHCRLKPLPSHPYIFSISVSFSCIYKCSQLLVFHSVVSVANACYIIPMVLRFNSVWEMWGSLVTVYQMRKYPWLSFSRFDNYWVCMHSSCCFVCRLLPKSGKVIDLQYCKRIRCVGCCKCGCNMNSHISHVGVCVAWFIALCVWCLMLLFVLCVHVCCLFVSMLQSFIGIVTMIEGSIF